MPSQQLSQAARKLVEQREAAAGRPLPDLATRRAGFEQSTPPAPADVTITSTKAGGVAAEWQLAPGSDPNRRLLYLHGGGYSVGSPRSHQRLGADISRAAGCAVLSLDYRMAPEHPFPAAVDDALAALRWLRGNGPGGEGAAAALFVAGDSAGGGLTLATVLAARDAGDPLPNAAVTLSAWTDLAATGASMETRLKADPVLVGGREAIAAAGKMYAGSTDARHPLVSPLYADLAGLPPLLMQVGDDEVLLDDTLRFAERAKAAGVEVLLHVEPEAYHVYPLFAPDAPESLAAIAQIAAFVRRY